MKGCGEKDAASCVWNARAKDLQFIKKGKSKLILLLLVPGVVDNLGVEKIRKVCIILTQK